jgi:hypothetical protein
VTLSPDDRARLRALADQLIAASDDATSTVAAHNTALVEAILNCWCDAISLGMDSATAAGHVSALVGGSIVALARATDAGRRK